MEKAVVELGIIPEEEPAGLVASGFIEADEAAVTTEMGGRIVALYADESDEVTKGQMLVELDDDLLLAQIGIARADLAVSEAILGQVEAPTRQEALDHAQALLAQAKAAQQAAFVRWTNARAMVENPQELELAITGAQAQAEVLELQERQAQVLASSAQAGRELTEEIVQMLNDFEPYNIKVGDHQYRVKIPADVKIKARQEKAMSTYESWEAWAGLDQVSAARIGAEQYLAELQHQRANPLALEAEASAAESQYAIATSAVAIAQAQVDALQIGATPEQIAAAEAQVGIARAALDSLNVQAKRFALSAPISGLVLERPVHVGELALPGSPLLVLADLDSLTLTVYVPENELGQVGIGQPVSVTVDAYPDRVFSSTVAFIASEAEFTPKNVQTREERVNMVFAVKVRLPNADHALKPGMPADAVFITEDG
jgi:multidrug resistance efflux pump